MGFLDKLLGRGKQVAGGVVEAAGDVVEKTADVAGDVAKKGIDVAGDVFEKGKEVAGDAVEKAGDLFERDRDDEPKSPGGSSGI
jgi:hypothetical protein